MGLFNALFGGKDKRDGKTKKTFPWRPLEDMGQLREISEKSHARPQVIFKHSTSCGISRMVLNLFRDNNAADAHQADLYFLDVHRSRKLSNEISDKFKVRHQSPQVVIIKNGSVATHESHGAISELKLSNYLK